MAANSESQLELRLFGHLLGPSYLSASVAVGSASLLFISATISRLYWSDGWVASTLQTIRDSNDYIFAGRTGSGDSAINSVLLFVFWACVGLAVYFLAMGVVRAINELHQLEQQVNYVHTDRRAVMRRFVSRMAVRIGALILLFGLVSLYLQKVLPYALTTIKTIDLNIGAVFSMLLGFILLVLTMHLAAILLRMMALRPRLFSEDIG